jgi:hypothetical protein
MMGQNANTEEVTKETTSTYESVRPFVLMGAGAIVLLAVIMFLIALIIKN